MPVCRQKKESLKMEGFETSEDTARSDMVLGLSGGTEAGSRLRSVCVCSHVRASLLELMFDEGSLCARPHV